jgi:PPE-repeat protein
MRDFGVLPPEVNSAQMYAGPGAGPLLASASAWDGLAVQLDAFAARYSSEMSGLQGQIWSGGASNAMTDAAAPYIAWITATAEQAASTAGQARSAAAAYEAAFGATVPPAVVAANRALLATLVVTNFLGQNTPAIAAAEADYAEMWAQDTAAMYGYAVSASAATMLTSFGQPPQTTNSAAQSSQVGAVSHAAATAAGHSQSTLSQLMSAAPQDFANTSVAEGSATQDSGTSASTPLLTAFADFDEMDGVTTAAYIVPKTGFQGGSFAIALDQSGSQAPVLPPIQGSGATAQTATPTGLSGQLLASVGRAAPVGKLSVPPSWTTATPVARPTNEPAGSGAPGRLFLPPWAEQTRIPSGMPAVGQVTGSTRGGGNAVFRMKDRRYRMPRPLVGG